MWFRHVATVWCEGLNDDCTSESWEEFFFQFFFSKALKHGVSRHLQIKYFTVFCDPELLNT